MKESEVQITSSSLFFLNLICNMISLLFCQLCDRFASINKLPKEAQVLLISISNQASIKLILPNFFFLLSKDTLPGNLLKLTFPVPKGNQVDLLISLLLQASQRTEVETLIVLHILTYILNRNSLFFLFYL